MCIRDRYRTVHFQIRLAKSAVGSEGLGLADNDVRDKIIAVLCISDIHATCPPFIHLSVKDPAVRGDRHDLPRDEFSALLQGGLRRVLQSAAAGDLHADNGHAFYIIAPDAVSYTHLDVYKRKI